MQPIDLAVRLCGARTDGKNGVRVANPVPAVRQQDIAQLRAVGIGIGIQYRRFRTGSSRPDELPLQIDIVGICFCGGCCLDPIGIVQLRDQRLGCILPKRVPVARYRVFRINGFHLTGLKRGEFFLRVAIFLYFKVKPVQRNAGKIVQFNCQRLRADVFDREGSGLIFVCFLRAVGHVVKLQNAFSILRDQARKAQTESAILHPPRIERRIFGDRLPVIRLGTRCVIIPAGADIAIRIRKGGDARAVVFRNNDRIGTVSVSVAVQCELPARNELYVFAARICGKVGIGDEFRRFGVRARKGRRLFGIDSCGTDKVERSGRTVGNDGAAGRGQLGSIAELNGIRLVEQLDLAVRDAQLGTGTERNSPPCRRIDGMTELAAAHGKGGAAGKEKLIAAVLRTVVLDRAARHRNGGVFRVDRAAIAVCAGGFVAADLGAAADRDLGGAVLCICRSCKLRCIDRAAVLLGGAAGDGAAGDADMRAPRKYGAAVALRRAVLNGSASHIEGGICAPYVDGCAASSIHLRSCQERPAILDGAALHMKGRGLLGSRRDDVYRRAISGCIAKIFDCAALHGKGRVFTDRYRTGSGIERLPRLRTSPLISLAQMRKGELSAAFAVHQGKIRGILTVKHGFSIAAGHRRRICDRTPVQIQRECSIDLNIRRIFDCNVLCDLGIMRACSQRTQLAFAADLFPCHVIWNVLRARCHTEQRQTDSQHDQDRKKSFHVFSSICTFRLRPSAIADSYPSSTCRTVCATTASAAACSSMPTAASTTGRKFSSGTR